MLDASDDFAGVLPNPSERLTRDNEALECVEYFCGAFSGWTQVFDALPSLGLPCNVKLALGISGFLHECIPAKPNPRWWLWKWLQVCQIMPTIAM